MQPRFVVPEQPGDGFILGVAPHHKPLPVQALNLQRAEQRLAAGIDAPMSNRRCRVVQIGQDEWVQFSMLARVAPEPDPVRLGRAELAVEPFGRNRQLVMAVGGHLEVPFVFSPNAVQLHELLHQLLAHAIPRAPSSRQMRGQPQALRVWACRALIRSTSNRPSCKERRRFSQDTQFHLHAHLLGAYGLAVHILELALAMRFDPVKQRLVNHPQRARYHREYFGRCSPGALLLA